MNDFDAHIGTALRDRVADVHPDLDRLVAASTRAGTRIRRRRTAGVSLASALAVAAVAVVATQIAGGGQTRSVDPSVPIASEPTATAVSTAATPEVPRNADGLAVGETIDFGGDDTGTVVVRRATSVILVRSMDSERLSDDVARYPHTPIVWEDTTGPTGQPPVTVSAKGWFCQWFVADEKGICSTGGAMVTVNWRPASEHAGFADPARADVPGAKAHTYVGPVHGDLFLTIQPMAIGTSQQAIDALAGALAWR
ncbi:hypothetical protein SAMN04487968_111108 [Nocardioides terrae]|uniref:Uncharacterized protein n=1 Tax=Nocardioides terrae TaxID=574651 RepID=A0A1I1M2R2_9ACTN|nr:hypothetical protein [Nocardioides terrae]SFC79032.1 hypothetical protein SAMN04487968_111108 [Nocardioides terrae]